MRGNGKQWALFRNLTLGHIYYLKVVYDDDRWGQIFDVRVGMEAGGWAGGFELC